MKNRGRNISDKIIWIEDIINSCETYEQTLVAKKLITNFNLQLNPNNIKSFKKFQIRIIIDLLYVLSEKQNLINFSQNQ